MNNWQTKTEITVR